MKDYLAEFRLDNKFPANRTQTMYTRFLRMPHTSLEDRPGLYKDMKNKFKLKPIKTAYWENI